MNKLNSSDLEGLFAKIKDIMVENKENLFKLDSAIGDGDLGITMSTGFSKVYEMISVLEEEDIGKTFINPKGRIPRACPWVSTLLSLHMLF